MGISHPPTTMIERKLTIVACVAGTLLASCTPYPENYRKPNPPGQVPKKEKPTVSDVEQQKIQAEREKARLDAQRKAEEQAGLQDNGTTPPSGDTPIAPDKPQYEYATPVPGRPGFVLSPYNGKMIDVKGIPSGTLVADPAYPKSEKKYFLVP